MPRSPGRDRDDVQDCGGSALFVEDDPSPCRDMVEEMRERLASVVAYTLLLAMKEDLPEDVSACLLHLNRMGAELNAAMRRLPCLAPAPDPAHKEEVAAVIGEGCRHG